MNKHNAKGIFLAASIIFVHFSIVSCLQWFAVRNSTQIVNSPDGRIERRGAEMNGFTVTAYCPGRCCNGIWAGLTATGHSIKYYTSRHINIAAVDPAVIPMGTDILYDGTLYRAVDRGSKIKGRRIDVLVPDHASADEFGVKRDQKVVLLEPADRGTMSARLSPTATAQ